MLGHLDNLGPRDTLSSGSNGNRSNRCGTAVHHSEQGTTEYEDTRTTRYGAEAGAVADAVADEYTFMSCGSTVYTAVTPRAGKA